MEFTSEEYSEFRSLVIMTESRDQVTRINGRLRMPAFVEKHGKEKCDAMFAKLCADDPK